MYVKGIGPKRAEALYSIGIKTTKDLLRYYPYSYVDRNSLMSIDELKHLLKFKKLSEVDNLEFASFSFQQEFSVVGQIIAKDVKQFGKRKLLTLLVRDDKGGKATINFWQRINYFSGSLLVGELITVNGKPEIDKYGLVFTHPSIDKIDKEFRDYYEQGKILPKYSINGDMQVVGINQNVLRRAVNEIIDEEISNLVDSFDEEFLKHHNLLDIKSTVYNIHLPKNKSDLQKAISRMKFDELFYYQLLRLENKFVSANNNLPLPINTKSELARNVLSSLPFKLTPDQKGVLNEIVEDINKGKIINRLIQGDVGSGKTIVALLIFLMVIENDLQTIFMAPTELLAEQHYKTISKFLEGLDIEIVLLTGTIKGKKRQPILEKMKSGEAKIIIGTHALFQKGIEFHKIGMIAIDEQHRFGVEQRSELQKLAAKSLKNYYDEDYLPHILVISATPIPRTLSLTLYSDLDRSIIKSMPLGRKPIKTKVVFESEIEGMYQFIKNELNSGRQAYFVFPLIDESEKSELESAVKNFEYLSEEVFPTYKLALLHSKVKPKDKEQIMLDFKAKKYHLIVSTTVIEVGIDVPNASVMVIQNAENFGLSQLHQLRGRVGRGAEQSYCLLIAKEKLKFYLKQTKNDTINKFPQVVRLNTMEETNDGFKIAEVDLKLRGPGDLMGKKQSGLPDFKFADLINDVDLIEYTKETVVELLKEDSLLELPKNSKIKLKLNYLKSKNFIGVA